MPEHGHLGHVDDHSAHRPPSSASVVDSGVTSTSRDAEPRTPPNRGGEGRSGYGGSVLNGRVDRPASGIVVVRLAGELDMVTASRAWELIRLGLSAGGLRTIVLDLSELSFIGSAGLSVLVDTQTHARAVDIAVRLITASACVDRALEITGLRSDFVCVSDVESALR